MVADGEITQEEADALIEIFETCDGTQQHLGLGTGYFGNGRGNGLGNGLGCGRGGCGLGYANGYGSGNGNGFGR